MSDNINVHGTVNKLIELYRWGQKTIKAVDKEIEKETWENNDAVWSAGVYNLPRSSCLNTARRTVLTYQEGLLNRSILEHSEGRYPQINGIDDLEPFVNNFYVESEVVFKEFFTHFDLRGEDAPYYRHKINFLESLLTRLIEKHKNPNMSDDDLSLLAHQGRSLYSEMYKD